MIVKGPSACTEKWWRPLTVHNIVGIKIQSSLTLKKTIRYWGDSIKFVHFSTCLHMTFVRNCKHHNACNSLESTGVFSPCRSLLLSILQASWSQSCWSHCGSMLPEVLSSSLSPPLSLMHDLSSSLKSTASLRPPSPHHHDFSLLLEKSYLYFFPSSFNATFSWKPPRAPSWKTPPIPGWVKRCSNGLS